MDSKDLALLEGMAGDDHELKRLMTEHDELEERLDALGKLCYLTPDEALEQRTLKKRKLVGRDRLEQILREHRPG
jgi:uncharacterized protein